MALASYWVPLAEMLMSTKYMSTTNPINITRQIIGGLPIINKSRHEFSDLLLFDWKRQMASQRTLPPKIAYSVNGQILAEVNSSKEMLSLFKKADYLDADGMWLVFASRIFSKNPLPERVATTDFFHDVASISALNGISFYILGSSQQNNSDACNKLNSLYPDLKIVGSHHGFFSSETEDHIIRDINNSGADIVWIAMGYPRQELLAEKLSPYLTGVTWVKTCGGLLEHILELQPRAPLWIQKIGFEWLYRLCCEPRRLGLRYIKTNPLALWYLLTRTESRSVALNAIDR